MNIDRLKMLSGIEKSPKKQEVSFVTESFEKIKLSQEITFKSLAKKHGAISYSVVESGLYSVGTICFNEGSLEHSNKKMNDFKLEWNNYLSEGLQAPALNEEKMTAKQKAKREQIVLAMKKDSEKLKATYGDDWEKVMYATATKQALQEDKEESSDSSLDDACWDGYKAIGTKNKNGKDVPNCVPVNEDHGKGYYVVVDGEEECWCENLEKAQHKKEMLKKQGKEAKIVKDDSKNESLELNDQSIKEARERKTVDEYEIHGYYGGSWEVVNTENDIKSARRSIREYGENEPGTAFKIVKKRIKKKVSEATHDETLYVLYVGEKGSGKLHQQFSDDTAQSCHQEFKDSYSSEYDSDGKKIKYVHKVLKQKPGESLPLHIEEGDENTSVDIIYEIGNNNFLQTVTDDKNKLNDRMGVNVERSHKIEMPSNVKRAISNRLSELKDSIEKYDEKGYNDHSQKQKAIDCLNQIVQNLSSSDLEGLKQAQIFFSTLMSPITDLFPAEIVNFLANAEVIKEQEDKDRIAILKRHIAYHIACMNMSDKDSWSYKDHQKQLERYKKELSQYE